MCNQPPTKEWVDYVIALTPAVIALFASWIAFQQWKTNKGKLRLDLYNKRFSIYERTLALYRALFSSQASFDSKEFMVIVDAFSQALSESKFLFNPAHGVHDALDKFHRISIEIVGFNSNGKDLALASPEVFIQWHGKTQSSLLQTLPKLLEEVEAAMRPYLAFYNVAS